MDVDSCDGRSSRTALSSTAVGDTTGYVTIDTVGVDDTRSSDESSTVPGRASALGYWMLVIEDLKPQ